MYVRLSVESDMNEMEFCENMAGTKTKHQFRSCQKNTKNPHKLIKVNLSNLHVHSLVIILSA